MADIDAYVSLKTLAAYFMDEVDKSIKDADKIWLLMLRGMVKLGYAFSAEPETVMIGVPDNKVVPFPNGCLSWSKIGILDEKGEVSTLRINNSLTKWRDNNPQRITNLTENTQVNDTVGLMASTPLFLNYYYNNSYNNLFGLGNGLIQYGSCSVDEKNRVVVLDMGFRYTSILFEGIFAPERMGGDYKVPTYLQEALIAFAKWKTGTGSRQEFYAEATEARRTPKKVTLQRINQVIRESNGMKLRS